MPCAAQEALRGPEKFPEFRNLSGLAGGGYGVDAAGYPSDSGPTALSTPTAYVLGHGRFAFMGAQMSNAHIDSVFGTHGGNGTLTGTYGTTAAGVDIAISDMVLSTALNQAFNLQLGYTPPSGRRIGFSAGIQDLRGGGGSAGTDFPGDMRSSRSLFGAITVPMKTRAEPVYVSFGGGTRRFKNGFVSASFRLLAPARAYAEYDGFGLNEGVLTTWQLGRDRGRLLNLGLAFVKSEYLTVYGGIVF